MEKVVKITTETVKSNQLYLWVANGPSYTTRIVRLSGCGHHLVENGVFEPEYWDLDCGLIGELYPISIDIDAEDLIAEPDRDD